MSFMMQNIQKNGKDFFLRIYIDKEDGIGIEDCEKVSGEINKVLDEADYIKEQYFLEVSSPGIERILRKDKQLEKANGENIEIKLFKPIDKQKTLEGVLLKFDKEKIFIQKDAKEISIDRKDIAQIKTKYNW